MSADDMDTNFLHNIKCEPELDIDCMSDGTTNSSEPDSQMQWPMLSESPNNFDISLVSILEPEIDLNEPPVHLVMKKGGRTNVIPMNNNANVINITKKQIPIPNIPQQVVPEKQIVQKKTKRGTGQPKSNAQMMREYRRRRKEDPVKYAEYLQRERIRNAKRKRLKSNRNATQMNTILDTEMCRQALSQNGVEMSIIPKKIQTTVELPPKSSSTSDYTLDDLLNELATDDGHNNARISRTLNAIETRLFNQNNAISSVKHQAPSLISTNMETSVSTAAVTTTASTTPATTSRLRVRSDLTTTKEVKILPNMLPLSICNTTTQLNHFDQINTRPPKIEVPIIYKKFPELSSVNNKSSKKLIIVHKKQSISPPPLLPLPGIKIEKFQHTASKPIKKEPIKIKTEIIDLEYGDIGVGGSKSISQDEMHLNLALKSSPTSSSSTSSSSFASSSGCGGNAGGKTRIRRANSKSTTTILGETASVSRNSRTSGVKKSPGKPHFLDSFLEYVADKVDERKVFDYLRPKNKN